MNNTKIIRITCVIVVVALLSISGFLFVIMNQLMLQSEIIQVNNFPSKESFFNKFGEQKVYDDVDFMMREGIIKDRKFLADKEMCLFPLNVIPHKYIVVYFNKQSGKTCCVSWGSM